jgi:hypothetical protein
LLAPVVHRHVVLTIPCLIAKIYQVDPLVCTRCGQ